MQVSSRVTMNFPRLHQLSQAALDALEMTAEALHTEVVQAQRMPFDTGHLEEDSTFVDGKEKKNGKVSIVSSTPYARRLYFHPEYSFRKDENSHAGGEWFKPWLPGGSKQNFAKKTFQAFYKRIGGV